MLNRVKDDAFQIGQLDHLSKSILIAVPMPRDHMKDSESKHAFPWNEIGAATECVPRNELCLSKEEGADPPLVEILKPLDIQILDHVRESSRAQYGRVTTPLGKIATWFNAATNKL